MSIYFAKYSWTFCSKVLNTNKTFFCLVQMWFLLSFTFSFFVFYVHSKRSQLYPSFVLMQCTDKRTPFPHFFTLRSLEGVGLAPKTAANVEQMWGNGLDATPTQKHHLHCMQSRHTFCRCAAVMSSRSPTELMQHPNSTISSWLWKAFHSLIGWRALQISFSFIRMQFVQIVPWCGGRVHFGM